MTYLLQSNVSVPDPTGRFPIVTPFGLADPDLGRFYFAQKAAGLVMSADHYNAFATFIASLKAAAVWDNIKEIYPLYGTSFAGACIKLRQKYAAGPLTALNGLAIADMEVNANGFVVGAAAGRAYLASNSKMFSTGVTAGQVASGFGLNVYADALALAFNSSQVDRNIFGCYLNNANGFQVLASARIQAADNRTLRVQNTGNAFLETAAVASPKGLIRYEGKTSGAIYLNGDVQVSGAVPAGSTGGLSKVLSLLGKTPADGADITQGFNGALRFASIDDGTLDATKRGALRDATNTLLAALGRTFA